MEIYKRWFVAICCNRNMSMGKNTFIQTFITSYFYIFMTVAYNSTRIQYAYKKLSMKSVHACTLTCRNSSIVSEHARTSHYIINYGSQSSASFNNNKKCHSSHSTQKMHEPHADEPRFRVTNVSLFIFSTFDTQVLSIATIRKLSLFSNCQ